jgi:hypothetical protein
MINKFIKDFFRWETLTNKQKMVLKNWLKTYPNLFNR